MAVGGGQGSNTSRATDYAAMAAAHATWIRTDLEWRYLEPTQGNWDWSFDSVLSDVTANGMRMLGILHTVPSWANGGAGVWAPPSDTTLTTNFAYRTVKRYLPLGVTEWEIGNEVNLPHDGWTPDAATYATNVLAPTVAGVRQAATELGLSVTILTASLAPYGGSAINPPTFLADAYAAGASGFDAVGYHPYTDTPETHANMNATPDAMYSVMAAHGDSGKRIWATEYGAPTGGTQSVSESVQADLVGRGMATWHAKPYAGPLLWYSARDTGTDPTDREQHFGVLRNDGTAKPAYTALAAHLHV